MHCVSYTSSTYLGSDNNTTSVSRNQTYSWCKSHPNTAYFCTALHVYASRCPSLCIRAMLLAICPTCVDAHTSDAEASCIWHDPNACNCLTGIPIQSSPVLFPQIMGLKWGTFKNPIKTLSVMIIPSSSIIKHTFVDIVVIMRYGALGLHEGMICHNCSYGKCMFYCLYKVFMFHGWWTQTVLG